MVSAPQQPDPVWLEPPVSNEQRALRGTDGSGEMVDADYCVQRTTWDGNVATVNQGPDMTKLESCTRTAANADALPSAIYGATVYTRTTALQSALCGPEKANVVCDCSAETMQDPALALILNSQKDFSHANPSTAVSGFIEHLAEQTTSQGTDSTALLKEPPSTVSCATAVGMLPEEQRTDLENLAPSIVPEEGSSGSELRTVLTWQCTMPQSRLLSEEPSLKRPRMGAMKTEANRLGIDPAWISGFDVQHKGIQIPPWSVSTIEDKSFPADSQNIDNGRTITPLEWMTGEQKTPIAQEKEAVVASVLFQKLVDPDPSFQSSNGLSLTQGNSGVNEIDEKVTLLQPADGKWKKDEKSDTVSPGEPINASKLKTGNGIEASVENGVSCEICGMNFAKRSNKMRHIQTKHKGMKPFECDLCGTKFGLKADLGRHRFRVHESRSFCCSTCSRSFAERDKLEFHIRVSHEEDACPWKCQQCKIKFGRKSSLTRHQQTVHLQKRFRCRVCNRSYSQRFDAIRHERNVHAFNEKH